MLVKKILVYEDLDMLNNTTHDLALITSGVSSSDSSDQYAGFEEVFVPPSARLSTAHFPKPIVEMLARSYYSRWLIGVRIMVVKPMWRRHSRQFQTPTRQFGTPLLCCLPKILMQTLQHLLYLFAFSNCSKQKPLLTVEHKMSVGRDTRECLLHFDVLRQ